MIKSKLLKPIKIKFNFFQKTGNFFKKLFSKTEVYNYKIEFSDLKTGLYLFQIKGKTYKKDHYILLSRYQLITKLLYNSCNNYLIDTFNGQPIKKYDLFLINEDQKILLKTKEDYFHNTVIEKRDYLLASSLSNQYDLNIISKSMIRFNKPSLFIGIQMPKTYFNIGERLLFNVMLKVKEDFHYNNIPISSVDIFILDENDKIIKSKHYKNIDKGYISSDFFINELFKEGIYYIQVRWLDNVQTKKIYIFDKYSPQLYFEILPDKNVYYYEEKIKFGIEIFNKYGSYLKEGALVCDILYKKLDSPGSFAKYKYLISFNKKLKKGRNEFEVKVSKLLEKGNYLVKIIAKVRSNNGFQEADYSIIKIIKSDFDLKVENEYNIFEIGSSIELKYDLIRLTPYAKIKDFKFTLYKIDNIKNKTRSYVISKELKTNKNNFIFIIDKKGLYKAEFFIQDSMNRTLTRSIDLCVLSYTYGIDIGEKLEDIIIIQNKKKYEYSDIGKILILFPEEKIWYNIYISGNEIYYNSMGFAEKNYIIFDFPLYEKYSPEVFLNLIAYKKNRLYYKQSGIKIPYVNKYLIINSELSEKYQDCQTNKIKIEPSNYWGHDLDSNILFYTINRDFQELYNESVEDLYFKIYGSLRNNLILYNYKKEKAGTIDKTDNSFYIPGYIYSDHLEESLNNYELLFLNKKEVGEKEFRYNKYGLWRTYLFGFTDDTKIGLNYIDHFYKNDYLINYYVPEYLSIKDTVYLSLLIKNNKNINYKFRLNFDILNGKYRSEVNKYLTVKPYQYEELLLYFKPEYKSSTRITINNILPTEVNKREFYIKLLKLPNIDKKKNKSLKVSKYYYKLKFYSKGDIYYSKLKRAGWLWFKTKYSRGDDVVIRFKIKAREKMRNIRIVDYIPAGFEYNDQKFKYHLYKIKPFNNYGVMQKEEKIIFHIPELDKGVHDIYYILKAKIAGEYYLPGFTVLKDKKMFLSVPEKDYIYIK